MAKKKIAWVTPTSFLDTDIFPMRYLPDYFDITWLITKAPNAKVDNEWLIEEISQKDNITIEYVNVAGGLLNLKSLLDNIKLQKRIRGFDVVYQPYGFLFQLPIMMLLGNRQKTIVPVHNVNTPKGARLYYISKLYTEIAVRYFKNFAVFSNSQNILLKQKNPNANLLNTSFMLKDYGKATKERNNNLITFMNFGNIVEYKRLDVLIDAAQKAFEKTNIKFRVILAGHCKKWWIYKNHIKYPELFDIRLGRVEDSEIPNLFEESDYFVAPYQDIAQSGSTVVAVNYNKPIIASRIEAFEDIVEDGKSGYLIKPANVDDLADKIAYILKNHHAIYKALQNNQRNMIENRFKDSVITKQYVDFINSI